MPLSRLGRDLVITVIRSRPHAVRARLATVSLVVASLAVLTGAPPSGASHGTGSISGTVLDSEGEIFFPGVQVQVYPVGSLSSPHYDVTAGGGAYTISGLADGDYIVQYFWGEGEGDAAGHLYHRGYYDETIAWRYATPVTISGGEAVTGIDGHLENLGLCWDDLQDEGPFPDVSDGQIFCDVIDWLEQVGIATGFADGTYRPAVTVTRQAMAVYIHRYLADPGYVPPVVPSFSDVPTSHQFYEEIEWLASTGVTGGYTDGTFHPTDQITRQAMAAFLYRMADSPAYTAPATATHADVPPSNPFYDEIEWCYEYFVARGYLDGTFRPADFTTRATMAAQLRNWDGTYVLFGDFS